MLVPAAGAQGRVCGLCSSEQLNGLLVRGCENGSVFLLLSQVGPVRSYLQSEL